MALITVNLRLVRPQGTNDAPDPATGRVDFIPAAHGKYHNSLRTVEKVTSQIDAEGEMIPVELTPDLWKVTITPTKGNPWPEMLFELTEGMPEPVNLADLLPETVVDGAQLAKGDPGPIGPQGERGPEGPQGPQGTTAWADLTGKPDTYPSTVADVDGLQAIIDRLTYDSGRRAIWGELVNGWVAESSVYIQRTGNTVHLLLNSSSLGLNGADATDSRFWQMPVGFRPAIGNYGHLGWVSTTGTPTPVSIIKSIDYLATSQRGLVQGVISWPTNDPIPTTLPGEPS